MDLLGGCSRVDITVWEAGRTMMGWADPRNVARRAGEPLYARALALHDRRRDERFVFVCVELAIVTDVLRDAVLERLAPRYALESKSLMLAATHNHSGPGGFAGYLWYDVTCGGYSPRVFESLVEGIATAAAAALDAMEPATVRWIKGATPLRRYATNRAWRAYNRNPEVTKITAETAELGVDPEMQLLRVDSVAGRPLGMINWFGLHGTCFHGDATVVQPDHKGMAASLFEAEQGEGFVAMFAQGPCGDVTANRRFDRRRGVTVGPGPDDRESCSRVARLEAEAARTLFDLAADKAPETGSIVVAAQRERLVDREISPVHAGISGLRTTRPVIGLGMALGTDEGPGPLHPARLVQRGLGAAVRLGYAFAKRFGRDHRGSVQIPLVVFASDLEARIFGFLPAEHRLLPTGIEPELGATCERIRNGGEQGSRWLPTEIDVQVACIGSLAIAGVGAEPTTVAGWRLRASIRSKLRSLGVDTAEVVVSSYTNGYSGYLVTPEEHLEQGYESGAAIYGRWSLPAWQTLLDEVVRSLASDAATRTPSPRRQSGSAAA
jgi:neutral ceramidase